MSSSLSTFQLYIDGQFQNASTDRWFNDVNPATGQVWAQVAEADANDVDRAVQAAQRAFEGPWAQMPTSERLNLLDGVADGIMRRFDDFLRAEILDTGKPRGFAEKIDIPRGAANFRIFTSIARSLASESFWSEGPAGSAGSLNYVIRQPVGVVGVICPWNLPLLLMTWKVAPALAAGNTVVVKPSEETPATATLLAEVFDAIGVPAGVFNIVHGYGPQSAGQALVQHPDVAAITFTGESRTGQTIMRQGAEHLKKVSFELGGKNPAIIFADCDFERAIEGTARSVFSNTGQVCLCSERVYVERPIFDRFVDALRVRADSLRVGDPFDPQTTLGPLISAEHRDKVLRYFEHAQRDGATLIRGGEVAEAPGDYSGGFFVEPTLWTGLSENAPCVREEIFGPVCHLQPFDDEDQAIALANDTPYGLCAAVWTENVHRAHRVAHRLQTGLTWVNTWFLRDLRTPFGGVKLSGLGREGGRYSMDFYSHIRNICMLVQAS